MRPLHIVMTGIPASGKSTIGSAIAEALSMEMLDKDEILEDLFRERGVGDLEWRATLSRAADEILRDRALRSESSVIVSWWRHPASTSISGTSIHWLSELQGHLIEVHCVCDPLTAADRFKSRTRHAGHLDDVRTPRNLQRIFEQHASLGPLRIGPLLEVNTGEYVDLADVLKGVAGLTT